MTALGNEEYIGRLTSGSEQAEVFVRKLVSQIEQSGKAAQEDFIKGLVEALTKYQYANLINKPQGVQDTRPAI
jgi:hypothetical protein